MKGTHDIKAQELRAFCVQNEITFQELKEIQANWNVDTNNRHLQRILEIKDKKIISGDLRIDFKEQALIKGQTLTILHNHEILILRILFGNVQNTITNKKILDLLEAYGIVYPRSQWLISPDWWSP